MKRLILLFLSIFVPIASAATYTSWDVHNDPKMYLNVGISATQTSNIQIAAPKINNTTITFPTTSGGILHLTQGTHVEDIYYASASVNATTKIVTLSGVVRNICFNQGRTIVSCGDGLVFSKGATMELTNDARLFNLKANIDRPNTFTATQTFSGSGTIIVPVFATTAARDHQIPSPSNGMIVYVTADGVLYQYINDGWTTFASGTTSNATETVAGKVQLGTVKDQSGATLTGSTGAPTVVQTRYLTTSGGTVNRGRVPLLDHTGYLSGSLLGSNTPSATTILYGDQTWRSISASGANLAITTSHAADVNYSSTSYGIIAHELSGSLAVNVGSVIEYHLIIPDLSQASGGSAAIFNFQAGNGQVASSGSGSLGFTFPNGGTSYHYIDHTFYAKSSTGGTINVYPIVRVQNGAMSFNMQGPIYFQAIVIK